MVRCIMIYLDKFNGYTIKCFLVTTGNVGKKLSAEWVSFQVKIVIKL